MADPDIRITDKDREYASFILEDLEAYEVDPNGETKEQIVAEWVRKIRCESFRGG